ncbi:choice-of-anchor D domain-containing protein [Formosa sp. 3Alg 14/1]|uniref:choice-of-anchor D domain-containing protein n=1 Tax=Formosa sp. 3Alg 14/1 TaxID=3382190 RepID=UPI0039BE64F3
MIKKYTLMMMIVLLSVCSFSQTITIDIPISSSGGSAEEAFSDDGYVSTSSSDLEFYHDGATEQIIGLYFDSIDIPNNAIITNAYIQFEVDEEGAGDVTVSITADASDNATPLGANGDFGLSVRPSTASTVNWAIPSWVGQKGNISEDQRTPNISSIITEITSRSGWSAGNSMAFLFSGVSRTDGAWREASSHASGTPKLHVEYTLVPSEINISKIDVSISSQGGSAEEAYGGSGYVSTISSDLELYYDGSTEQVIGLHFENIELPKDASITKAYIQFEVDENGAGDVTVNIKGDASDNATYLGTNGNFGLSGRATTNANIIWDIPSWEGQKGQATVNQRTPDISTILTEITSRNGWSVGNNMAFIFSGISRSEGAWREASSFSNGKPSIHIEYVTPPNEIDVTGNNTSIINGDTMPNISNYTQFPNGGINQWLTRTYSVKNVGKADLNLTGNPLVSISGNAEFSVLKQPSSSVIKEGESVEFVIKYAPTSAETNQATVKIANDDSDESAYTFNIQGTGEIAVIALDVLGNTTSIVNGDSTPDSLDHTDFGEVYTYIGKTQNYTIKNTGNSMITISSIKSSNSDFIINSSESTVNVGESISFGVTLIPTTLDHYASTITISSNVPDENAFTFNVHGQGTDPVFPSEIKEGDAWFYLSNGGDQSTAWRTLTFDQSNWVEAVTEIGYGDGDEVTDIGQPESPRPITTYFRKFIDIPDVSMFNSIDLEAVRDDGIVVYINDVEVWRNNMPEEGLITYNDVALTGISGSDESVWNYRSVSSSALKNGVNIIAVEIHQEDAMSSDISFDFKLVPSENAVSAPPTLVERGPYLQSGSPTSVVVKWRTDVETASVVNYGTELDNLYLNETNAILTTEHEVKLTGLEPNTKYYFNIANQSVVVAESVTGEMFVKTAPVAGTDQFVRAWILGDAGTGSVNQRNVRDAYYNYVSQTATHADQTDMMLFLGDNAYSNGTDAEHQSYFFDVYDDMLKKSVAWSCLGNHDGYTSDLQTQSGPYYDIFTFPTAGEAGGIASGTEAYYSFDYANIHFIVLDSHQSSREVGGSQYNWALTDIQNTTQDWIVALFHHPAYSKGSHDSDYEGRLIDMRENFMPILEANGVDLVLNGHSHSYERSYFINGHQGFSNTFNPNDITNGGHTVGQNGIGDGKTDSDGAYKKAIDAAEGTVYITTGSAGQISGGDLNHQAMSVSLNQLGSCVMEIEDDGNGGQNLNVKFIRDNGDIDDYFTINKTGVTLEIGEEESFEKSIKIFPVPANELLNIKMNPAEKLELAKIYNSIGELILETNRETINVSKLATGMYVIEIKSDKNTYYKSIIIE